MCIVKGLEWYRLWSYVVFCVAGCFNVFALPVTFLCMHVNTWMFFSSCIRMATFQFSCNVLCYLNSFRFYICKHTWIMIYRGSGMIQCTCMTKGSLVWYASIISYHENAVDFASLWKLGDLTLLRYQKNVFVQAQECAHIHSQYWLQFLL